jgi:lysophospholipase L1-like esterase
VVALGDSVPAGGGCSCTPYPQLSASSLTVPGTREVAATNDAVNGATSSDVLASVTTDPQVESHLAAADVVEIEIGANDVAYGAACGTTASCYQPSVATVEQNLRDIVARVHDLTHDHAPLVVLLDYWSVWLGGTYAAAKGQAYVDAAAAVTDDVNTVIRQTAAASGAAYVDLRAAFKGPDYAYDETHYLAPDGDHPNALGHQQIAKAVVQVVDAAVHP